MPRRPPGAPPKPIGRPSKFDQAIADEICDRYALGELLGDICADPHMPDRTTVWRWQDTIPAFSTAFARARERQADAMDEKIRKTADASTNETAAADRIKLLAYQWRAARLRPRMYGDKVQTEVTGKDGAPLIPEPSADDRELSKAILAILSGAVGPKAPTES